jgi:hypothetical protein
VGSDPIKKLRDLEGKTIMVEYIIKDVELKSEDDKSWVLVITVEPIRIDNLKPPVVQPKK